MVKNNKKAFGGVASTLIMFIAIITVTTGLVISFMNYTQTTKQSFDSQTDLASNKLRTSISISNIYYNESNDYLYVYVKNIGETKLPSQELDFYINDHFEDNFSVLKASDLVTPVEIFEPQQTVVISEYKPLNSGTHKVKVVTGYGVGIGDYFNI